MIELFAVPPPQDDAFLEAWNDEAPAGAILHRALRADVPYRFAGLAASAGEHEGGVLLIVPFEVPAGEDARFRAAEADASPIHTIHAGAPPIFSWYGKAAEPLPADSSPADYIHSPAQGEILADAARASGASVTLRTAADTGGWRGFLDEAVPFLDANLGR